MNLPQRALMPVVHAETEEQALRNVGVALDHGAHGAWLIGHKMGSDDLLRIVARARERFAAAWLGVNLLYSAPDEAFEELGLLQRWGVRVNGLWVDNPMVEGANPGCARQDVIATARKASLWRGDYYAGVAFKYLPQPDDVPHAAGEVRKYADVLVTSGPATGVPATIAHVEAVRAGAQETPVGLASGVDEGNLEAYVRAGVTRFLVAKSLSPTDAFGNQDDANLDGAKVERMRKLLDTAK